jgi:hypothetical protein
MNTYYKIRNINDYSQLTNEIINCEFDIYKHDKIYLKNYTLLQHASNLGYLEIVELLIEKEQY